MLTMPEVVERNAKLIGLAMQALQIVLLVAGLIWAASQFWGDTKSSGAALAASNKALEAKVETLSSQQQATNIQLEGIKTQMRYVENSVLRLERTMERIAPKL